jgi:DNA modification methylase
MKQAEVLLTDIEFGERFRKDYGNITELVTSIQKEGLIQPLAVYHQPEKEFPYLLLAGGRRYTACTKLEMTAVPVLVFDKHLEELDIRGIELAENIYRKDLEWYEKIKLEAEIHRLQQTKFGKGKIPGTADGAKVGWSGKDTAEMLGIDNGKLSKDLVLNRMVESMPMLKECKSADEARKILQKMAQGVVKEELSQKILSHQNNTPVDIQRKELVNRFIIGDFLTMVKSIPDRSIDLIEMDPPYGINLNNTKKSDDNLGLQMGSYNEVKAGEYLVFLNACLAECYRVMAPDSWIILWFAPEPWFDGVFQLLRKYNFEGLRMPGIWVKEGQTGQSHRPDLYMANNYEMFFYARKGQPSIKKQGRSNNFNYMPVKAMDKEHPTEKPIELYMDLLSVFAMPQQRLMVPFLGSGNTLLAAENLGIQGFGYELSPDRKDGFTIKAFSERPGQYRSYK